MPHVSPRTAAYACGCLFAIALACDLLWMPIQVGDSLGEILDARESPSVVASFREATGTAAYLRPMRIAQIKALFDAAQGTQYWLVYRGFHALLVIAAVLLFTRALRVSSATDAGGAAFGLAVLVGLHTFRGTVQEAFPINHFLEILVCCLLTLNLAQSRGGLWRDLLAALTFVFAVLTLESGLLVWVVAVTAWGVGWRGISTRGIATMTALMGAYVYLRFVHLSTGLPELTERSSGYLFELLEPSEIQERFGAMPLWFYGYNLAASIAGVLFAEPRSGVLASINDWMAGRPPLRVVIPITTSLATTALMLWAAAGRLRARQLDDTARLLVIFVFVLLANAALSFAYTKDEIMSIAGAFYALAAFGAMRAALQRAGTFGPQASVAVALALAVLATGWSIRAAGVHYVLRSQAIKQQIDWVDLPAQWRRDAQSPEQPLILKLRQDAIRTALPNTRADRPEWPSHVWNE
jgi:hypothetical protein